MAWKQPAIVFVIALVVRLIHVWQMREAPFFSVLLGDSRGYDEWARRIAAGEWLGTDVFYQAPLYPYFLGAIYTLLGRDLFVVRVCQAIVGALSCATLSMAAERLFSRRAGLIAGLGLALYAPAIFFDALIQKTVLDVFFLCLALFILSRLLDWPPEHGIRADIKGRALGWMCLGIVLGGLALTRENALVFVAVILVWIAARQEAIGMHGRRGWLTRARVTDAAALVLGVAVVLAPVAARNYAIGGGFYVTTVAIRPQLLHRQQPALRWDVHVFASGSRCPRVRTSGCDRARGTRVRAAAHTVRSLELLVEPRVGLHRFTARCMAAAHWTEGGCCSGTPTRCSTRKARRVTPSGRRCCRSVGGSGISACSCRWPCSA